MDVHFHKKSLLEYNSIYLAEGPWPGKAYFDARQRARERDAGLYLDYGFTRPKVFSRGPYNQHPTVLPMDENGMPIEGTPQRAEPLENVPRRAAPEILPAPTPEHGVSNAHGWNLFANARRAKTSEAPAQWTPTSSDSKLKLVAAKVQQSDVKSTSEVKLVNYEEPIKENQGWKSVSESRANDENQANRTSSSTPASTTGGWKRL
jgi:hypothetical protein